MKHIDEIQIAGTAILLCASDVCDFCCCTYRTCNRYQRAVTKFYGSTGNSCGSSGLRQKLRLKKTGLPFIPRTAIMIPMMMATMTILIMMTLPIMISRIIQIRVMMIQITAMELRMMEAMTRHRRMIRELILLIRLIIQMTTVQVTDQMVLWTILIYWKTMERIYSR